MLNELSLFTGGAGGVLGSKLLGHELVGYVEFDPYCQALIASHIRRRHLDSAPIFSDVRAFVRDHAHRYAGRVDVVSAGFPCQPFSVAGSQLAEDDPRNMWPATEAVLRVVRPPLVLLENVPGLIAKPYFGRVLGDLAALGFDAEWTVLGAHDVGAPHRRDRLWILAFSDAGRELLHVEQERLAKRRDEVRAGGNGDAERVADSEGFGWGQGFTGPPRSGGYLDERGEALHDSGSRDGDEGYGVAPGGAESGRSFGDASGRGGLLADSDDLREPQPEGCEPDVRRRARYGGHTGVVSDARSEGLEERRRCSVSPNEEHAGASGGGCAEGQPEPRLGGDAHGVADRLVWPAAAGEWPSLGGQHGWEPPRVLPRYRHAKAHPAPQEVPPRILHRRQRLKAIGNGQVPACVVAAWRELSARATEE